MQVAVKHIVTVDNLNPEDTWPRANVDVRVRREIVVWMRLEHPNIVPLLGTASFPQPSQISTGMVSHWMKNGNLNDFIKDNLDLDHRLQIVSNFLPVTNNFTLIRVYRPATLLLE